MLMTRKIVVLSLALLMFGVSATLAGPLVRKDKGASNNGVADSFLTCKDPFHTSNCGNFATTTSPGPDGTTITQFVTNSGAQVNPPAPPIPGTVVFFDVFTVPGVVTPGSVLTLNLSPSDNNFGIFACGNGNGQAIPGGGDPTAGPFLTGPCTVGDLGFSSVGNTPLDELITDTILGNTVTINFLSGVGFPSSWTFFTDPGGLVSLSLNGTTNPTPEPGSALLLLAGALAAGLIALKARR
jgi:hypothetical protein